jgi:hypothetical protein
MTPPTKQEPVRRVESRLDEWLKQPGTFVTPAERQFISDMRKARAGGVGFGWMQQVAEWEWQALMKREWKMDVGAWGPEYFEKQQRKHDATVSALQATVAERDARVRALTEMVEALRPQVKWLRAVADGLYKHGIYNWSNTCEEAADAIDALLSPGEAKEKGK